MENLFTRAGLHSSDGRVYASLETPDLNVMEIARAANLHRPATYRALIRLHKVNLVIRRTKGKRAVYRRAPTAILRTFLKTADKEIEKTLRAIVTPTSPDLTNVQILKGKEGISAVLDHMLDEIPRNGIFYRYSSRPVNMNIEKYVSKTYRKIRDAKHVQQFVIVNHGLRHGVYKKRVDAASKMVPLHEDRFEYGVNILIFGDKVAFVNFSQERAYIIHDKNVADLQRGIFKLLYNRLEE